MGARASLRRQLYFQLAVPGRVTPEACHATMACADRYPGAAAAERGLYRRLR